MLWNVPIKRDSTFIFIKDASYDVIRALRGTFLSPVFLWFLACHYVLTLSTYSLAGLISINYYRILNHTILPLFFVYISCALLLSGTWFFSYLLVHSLRIWLINKDRRLVHKCYSIIWIILASHNFFANDASFIICLLNCFFSCISSLMIYLFIFEFLLWLKIILFYSIKVYQRLRLNIHNFY